MNGFSKVILLGNLTRDPEIRYMPSGTAVAAFALAINRKFRQGQDLREEVSFIDVVVFGKQAENCGQYLNKGDAVLIDGRLQQRRWESDDGQKRTKLEVVAQNVQFMPKRPGSGGAPAPGGPGTARSDEKEPTETYGGVELEEDVPF
ncbi:MAG: single-stranded DNA-binding protein [Nitrospirae bacterium]|nr:single-stranded DNA-binding protein [Nitrospirota bacterium]